MFHGASIVAIAIIIVLALSALYLLMRTLGILKKLHIKASDAK